MLSIGAAVLIVGLALGTAGFFLGGMNTVTISHDGIRVLDGRELQEFIKIDETYNSFDEINLNVSLLDEVIIRKGDDYAVQGQNYRGIGGISASVKNGILEITTPEGNGWHGWNDWVWTLNLGIGERRTERCYIEITIPEDAGVDRLYANIDMSEVRFEGFTADSIELTTGSANVVFVDVKCSDLIADIDLGDLTLKNVAAEKASLNSDYGDVTLTGFSSGALELDSDLGDVEIEGVLKGKNRITSNNGNVDLSLDQRESDLAYTIDISLGEVRINGKHVSGSVSSKIADAKNTLRIDSDLGDVSLAFRK
jgi:hypothetical protein